MGIVLTNNAKFRPYTFDELLKPLAMATQEYRAIEEGIAELGSKADLMRMYANEEPNSKTASMYNTYANDLDKQAESLAKYGLNPTSRQGLLGLKRRYSSEIIPIETAVTRRRQLAEEQRKARAQDDSILFDVDARTMSLDKLIDNPELSYTSASGKNIMENVSKAASALAKEARNDPNYFNKLLGGDYYEYVKQHGFSSQAVLDAISRSSNASKILTGIVDNAVAASGVGKGWVDRAYDRAYDYANRGLWSAVGQTQTQLVDNWRAKLDKELEVAKIKAGLSGKNKTGTSSIDRTSYFFPKERDVIPTILDESGKLMSNPNKIGVASKYKDLVNDLFVNDKFTKPKRTGAYSNRSTEAEAYYNKINDILLNSGFSQETINNMDKATIENNIKSIMESNIADILGRNIYRFALDDTATEHLVGKLSTRGLKVQELEGLIEGQPKYGEFSDVEYDKGQSGDILFDAKTKDFLLLHQGHYYRLPKGMISNDLYNEIESYLGEDDNTQSRFSEVQNTIEYLKQKETLTEREQDFLDKLYEELYDMDTRLGTIGKEFTKYVGTKNTQ